MIRNERQYRITSHRRDQLADALDQLSLQLADNDQDLGLKLQQASLSGQLATLNSEILEYEVLRGGAVSTIHVASMADLPDALIRARIAAGMTQRDLGSLLGLKEQQIQRYESDRYATASLSRLRDVIEALGVTLEGGFELPNSPTPLSELKRTLLQFGFTRQTINKRFLRGATDASGPRKTMEIAERVARLLGVDMKDLANPPAPLHELTTTARFKAARNASDTRLYAYTRYAESIADIVLAATEHLGPQTSPGAAFEVRTAIESKLHGSSPHLRSDELLESLLSYLSNIRIPVIALPDQGAFHGACFTRGDRSVIVLKNGSAAYARWLYDLLHELDHARDTKRGHPHAWVELGAIGEWSDAPEEQAANNFAADVLFSGRTEPVLSQCLSLANGSIQRLKSVVPLVAEQAEIPVDILATQLAFRLAARGIDWWATASSLQEVATPWQDVNDHLLRSLDLGSLDTLSRTALMDAIAT